MILHSKTIRRRILQVCSDLFLHALSDSHIQEALHAAAIDISTDELRRELETLGGDCGLAAPLLAVQKLRGGEMWTAQITGCGIDVVTGASEVAAVRGVGPEQLAVLARLRDLRRGVLSMLLKQRGEHVEDTDLLEGFYRHGLTTLDVKSVQAVLWYLAQKKLVTNREIIIAGEHGYVTSITPLGCAVIENDATDVGVHYE